MLEESYQTLWACQYVGDADLRVVSTSSILASVSMQPLPPLPGERDDNWFVVEKSGLDDMQLSGIQEPDDQEVPDQGDALGEDLYV
jgi:hypothetical protein